MNNSSRASIKICGQLPRWPERFGLTFGSVTATVRQTSSTSNRSHLVGPPRTIRATAQIAHGDALSVLLVNAVDLQGE
jgi:hypothetical protein